MQPVATRVIRSNRSMSLFLAGLFTVWYSKRRHRTWACGGKRNPGDSSFKSCRPIEKKLRAHSEEEKTRVFVPLFLRLTKHPSSVLNWLISVCTQESSPGTHDGLSGNQSPEVGCVCVQYVLFFPWRAALVWRLPLKGVGSMTKIKINCAQNEKISSAAFLSLSSQPETRTKRGWQIL